MGLCALKRMHRRHDSRFRTDDDAKQWAKLDQMSHRIGIHVTFLVPPPQMTYVGKVFLEVYRGT